MATTRVHGSPEVQALLDVTRVDTGSKADAGCAAKPNQVAEPRPSFSALLKDTTAASDAETAKQLAVRAAVLLRSLPPGAAADAASLAVVPCGAGIARGLATAGVLSSSGGPAAAQRRVLFCLLCCVSVEKMLTEVHAAVATGQKRKGGGGAPMLSAVLQGCEAHVAANEALARWRPYVAVLRGVFLPSQLNLRNLLSHGFVSDIDDAYCALGLACVGLTAEFAAECGACSSTSSPAATGSKGFSLDGCAALCEAVRWSPEFAASSASGDEGMQQLVATVLALEQKLRLLFCEVNAGFSAADALAKTDEYYITLDGYGQRGKHEVLLTPRVGSGEANALIAALGVPLYSLLVDAFMAADGPNVRGAIMHGTVDLSAVFADGAAAADDGTAVLNCLLGHAAACVDDVRAGRGPPAADTLAGSYPREGLYRPTAVLKAELAGLALARRDARRTLEGFAVAVDAASWDVTLCDAGAGVADAAATLRGEEKALERLGLRHFVLQGGTAAEAVAGGCAPERFAEASPLRRAAECCAALEALARPLREAAAAAAAVEEGEAVSFDAPPLIGADVGAARLASASLRAFGSGAADAVRDVRTGVARSAKRRALLGTLTCAAPVVTAFAGFVADFAAAPAARRSGAASFAEKVVSAASQVRAWADTPGGGAGYEKLHVLVGTFATSRAARDAAAAWRQGAGASAPPPTTRASP
eukprot:Rhum_TRINITY_DN13119_c0_g1::Rhum_TRINITY_DN13119_c0_g1_i2::g.57198::m.57198